MSRRDLEKEAFWRMVLCEFEESGLTQAEFCRREGMAQRLLSDWRRTIRKRDTENQHQNRMPANVKRVPKKKSLQNKAKTEQGFKLNSKITRTLPAFLPIALKTDESAKTKMASEPAREPQPTRARKAVTGRRAELAEFTIKTPSGLSVSLAADADLERFECVIKMLVGLVEFSGSSVLRQRRTDDVEPQ